jgi:hypothetical protein
MTPSAWAPRNSVQVGPVRRPLQYPKLMAEDEDLEVLGSVVSARLSSASEEMDKSAGDEVEEGPHRSIVPMDPSANRGF